MKRIALTVLAASVAAPLLAQDPAPANPSSSGVRVAIIDVQRLVMQSAPGKEATGRLQKMANGKKEEADRLTKELKDLEQKITDQGASLAEDKREQLQRTYTEKATAFKRFQEDAQKELDREQKKELAELEKRVMPVIQQVGREKGYSLVFNKFEAGLLYADETADITEDVLKRFNTTVAVPAKPAPAATNDASKAPTPAPKKSS
ncbi:MAG TPA: OmpH family outer membrane protein [Thermoanaerobaculia bacterium]|jgi:outer membrane protein